MILDGEILDYAEEGWLTGGLETKLKLTNTLAKNAQTMWEHITRLLGIMTRIIELCRYLSKMTLKSGKTSM